MTSSPVDSRIRRSRLAVVEQGAFSQVTGGEAVNNLTDGRRA
jgi:hypothetical protein